MALVHPPAIVYPRHRSRREQLESRTPQRIRSEEFSYSVMKRLGVAGVERTVVKGNVIARYLKLFAPQPTDNTPIVISKGLLASALAYTPTMSHMAKLGRDSAVLRSVHYMNHTPGTLLQRAADVIKLEAQGAAMIIEDMVLHDGTTQADASGHSKGMLPTASLAARKPHLVRSVSGVGGAGLIPTNILDMGLRVPRIMRREIANNRQLLTQELGKEGMREIAWQVYDDPAAVPLQALACTTRSAIPDLQQADANGVNIGIRALELDAFFDAARMMSVTARQLPSAARVVEPGALHMHPQLYPELNAQQEIAMFDRLALPSFEIAS